MSDKPHQPKKKKFLRKPRLGGGKEALQAFLKEHLRYPGEALEKGIEGDVIVRYKVTSQGQVVDPQVVNGPGHGCDEEALRLVGMLPYEAVRNRGVRVTTNNRIRIPFRLKKKKQAPRVRMNYVPATKPSAGEEKPGGGSPRTQQTYTYTIKTGGSRD